MYFGARIEDAYSKEGKQHEGIGFSNKASSIEKLKDETEYKLTRIFNSENFDISQMLKNIRFFYEGIIENRSELQVFYNQFKLLDGMKERTSIQKEQMKIISSNFNSIIETFNSYDNSSVKELVYIFWIGFWRIDLSSPFKMSSLETDEHNFSRKDSLFTSIDNNYFTTDIDLLEVEKTEIQDRGVFDDITIGCFDSGINKNNYLNIETFNYIELDEDVSIENLDTLETLKSKSALTHGTIVSSLLSYGSLNIDDGIEKNFKVFNAEVSYHEKSEIPEAWPSVLDRMEKAIKDRRDIKIWNLSLNTKGINMVSAYERTSELGIEMDRLQEEYEIKIIIAAGNNDDEKTKVFIQSPCDSVFSSTVSSCDLAYENPADFSLKGFNSYKGIKPNILTFGGEEECKMKIPIIKVNSEGNDLNAIGSFGTSLSTPTFTRIWARIFIEIKNSNPEKEFKTLSKMVDAIITNGSRMEMSSKGIRDTKTNKMKEYFGEGISFKNWKDFISKEGVESFFINSDDPIKWIQAYSSFHIPSLDEYEYDIYATSISDVTIDNNWGVEYCRSSSRTKFTFAAKTLNSEGKEIYSVAKNTSMKSFEKNNTQSFDFKQNIIIGKWRRKFSYYIPHKNLLSYKNKFEEKFVDMIAEENFSVVLEKDTRHFKGDGTLDNNDFNNSKTCPVVHISLKLIKGDIDEFQKEVYSLIEGNGLWEVTNIIELETSEVETSES